jgi:hypothetical protein
MGNNSIIRRGLNMSKRTGFFVVIGVVLMLALAVFACDMPGGGVDEGDVADVVGDVVAEVAEEAEAVAEDVEEAAQEAVDEPEEAAPAEEGAGPIGGVSLDELDSYRMITRTSIQGPDGNWLPPDETEIAVVNNPPPPAQYIIVSAMGNTFETIIIGDMTWMNMGDGAWMELPPPEEGVEAFDTPETFDVPENLSSDMVLVGTETVNGVNCLHYTFDTVVTVEDLETIMGGMASGVPLFDSQVEGEIWIADEPGLPPVVVRSDMMQDMDMGDTQMVMRVEYELTDINQPIVIEPPPMP